MNTQILRLTGGFAALVLTTSFLQAHAEESAPNLRWVDTPGKSIELRNGDQPVVRYMYQAIDESSPETREKTYKPYLHVFSPDSKQLLTKGPGGLFPHHRGIFYGFNKITYGGGLKCDTWHCRGKAYEIHKKFLAKETDGNQAKLVSVIAWHGEKGEAFATETRAMEITLLPGQSGGEGQVQIDFTSELKPLGPEVMKVDGDPQHAGVQFRASQLVPDKTKDQTYYLRTDGKGKEGETRNWNQRDLNDPMNPECTNRPWNAASFVIDGQRYTVLTIDHPQNPKPARYSERDYARFGSYFSAKITADKPLKVCYRFVVQQGESTVEKCQAKQAEFVAAKP